MVTIEFIRELLLRMADYVTTSPVVKTEEGRLLISTGQHSTTFKDVMDWQPIGRNRIMLGVEGEKGLEYFDIEIKRTSPSALIRRKGSYIVRGS